MGIMGLAFFAAAIAVVIAGLAEKEAAPMIGLRQRPTRRLAIAPFMARLIEAEDFATMLEHGAA